MLSKPKVERAQPTSQRVVGDLAEERAVTWVLEQGWQVRHRNYACKAGELDIVALDAHTLVFIEVRARKSADFGGAAASVTLAKQQKVRRAAAYYLATQGLSKKPPPCRFDLIVFQGGKFDWIKSAF
jgi:putative endonuclease